MERIFKAPRDNWPPVVLEHGYSGSVRVEHGIAKTSDPVLATLLHSLGYIEITPKDSDDRELATRKVRGKRVRKSAAR